MFKVCLLDGLKLIINPQTSWGSRGSDKWPSVSSQLSGGNALAAKDVDMTMIQVDAAFKETVARVLTKAETHQVLEKPILQDQNKTFRAYLLVLWVLSNAGLALIIYINGLPNQSKSLGYKSDLISKQDVYFGVILYSTFGLDALRFTGVC